MTRLTLGMAGLAMALHAGATQAETKAEPLPPAIARLIDCRAMTESAARLACYDTQIAELVRATDRSEIVVLDKEAVVKTRRSLFGFSLPPLPFFNGGKDGDGPKDELISGIDSTISAAQSLGYGKWLFVIEDGARWQTTEAIPSRTPKPGMSIRLDAAALGSYKAKVNGWPAVRVKRVN